MLTRLARINIYRCGLRRVRGHAVTRQKRWLGWPLGASLPVQWLTMRDSGVWERNERKKKGGGRKQLRLHPDLSDSTTWAGRDMVHASMQGETPPNDVRCGFPGEAEFGSWEDWRSSVPLAHSTTRSRQRGRAQHKEKSDGSVDGNGSGRERERGDDAGLRETHEPGTLALAELWSSAACSPITIEGEPCDPRHAGAFGQQVDVDD